MKTSTWDSNLIWPIDQFFDLYTFLFCSKTHTLFTIYAQNVLKKAIISNENRTFFFVKFKEISCTLNSVFTIQLTEYFNSIIIQKIVLASSIFIFFSKRIACFMSEHLQIKWDAIGWFAFYKTSTAWMTVFLSPSERLREIISLMFPIDYNYLLWDIHTCFMPSGRDSWMCTLYTVPLYSPPVILEHELSGIKWRKKQP